MFDVFIRRPVLSLVISLLIVLLGGLSFLTLPISQFPDIIPPSVSVRAKYRGANAEVCAKTVATPLEKAINGVPGMKYMSSDTGNDGVGVVQILFETGTDPDVAAINVQNRVSLAEPQLPEEVTRQGLTTKKKSSALLQVIQTSNFTHTGQQLQRHTRATGKRLHIQLRTQPVQPQRDVHGSRRGHVDGHRRLG